MAYYSGISLEQQIDALRLQYLRKKGWQKSFTERVPVDANGPLPWITYPALEFLKAAAQPQWRIFEYGSGNSSLWWSQRSARVHSVDHDAEWIERLSSARPPNCDLQRIGENAAIVPVARAAIERFLKEVAEPAPPDDPQFARNAGLLTSPFHGYASAIAAFAPGHFDVVVIDGMARNLCTWMAVEYAQPKQFIVFDNSDRREYAPAYEILRSHGYRRVDFWGIGPINPYEWCTSIFVNRLESLPS
jgi:hypothetical protein